MNNYLLYIVLFASGLAGCTGKNTPTKQETNNRLVALPDDLSTTPDSLFSSIESWLKDVRIIGISEGTHGMNEPLDFRNSFIRYLVKNNKIKIIAFESGLLESRIINDFIQGKNLDLETVLSNGFSYGFGEFRQNKELLLWLRKINQGRKKNDYVRFYGFDMAGNAPNPYLEKSGFSLSVSLEYLQRVDPLFYNSLGKKLETYLDYLHIDDSPEDPSLAYADLAIEHQKELKQAVNLLVKHMAKKEKQYSKRSSKEKYIWGLQAARCAQQNIAFLDEISQSDAYQHTREKFMFENLQWIINREKGLPILVFAHLAHLSKEIYGLNESGKNTIPDKMLGEYIREFYGTGYKLIGNIFSSLNYPDGKDSVKAGSLPSLIDNLSKSSNFCLQTNSEDTLFTKPRIFGIPSPKKGDLWMTPSKGIDVIFYNRQQTDCFN